MSGIYIPDVGLPQDGDFELWMSIKNDGSYNYNISGRWNEGKRKAVPVPPHGRPGDLDELYAHLNEWYLTNNPVFTKEEALYIRAMLLGVVEAPTIIPAEEGET